MSLPVALQQTLSRAVECSGVALHGGQDVRVTLRPARRGGIVFRRVDLERDLAARGLSGRVEIPAALAAVTRVDHATTLSASTAAGTASVSTVEHLVAALHGEGIDACVVEVDGPEVPIFDGSSLRWVELLRSVGRRTLARARKRVRVLRPVSAESGSSSLTVYPADDLRVTCSIDFPHPAIGRQEISLHVTRETFASELAAARTFGFMREVEALRAAGLARGGTMENAIVLDDAGVMNGPLRWADEFARHKALDLVGDIALAGMPVAGHFVARRAGHKLHVELTRRLMADPASWVVEPMPSEPASAAARAVDFALSARSVAAE